MIPKNNLFSVTILILLSCLSSSSSSDPRISEAGLYCGRNRAPLKANYIPSFIKEMESLSDLVTNHNWGTHSIKLGSIPIYGLAQCFKHLSHTDCLLCYAASRTKLPRCLPSLSARIYFDGCFLRYDNYTFYSEDTDPQRDTLNCNSPFGFVVDHSEKLVLEKSVERVLDGVVRDAVSAVNGGFSVGEFQGVYGLAQCWNTLGSSKCRKCLMKGVREIRGCLPNRQGRALNAGCYLRYSTHQFYNSSSAPSASINKRSSLRTGVIIAVVLAIAALMILTFSASYLLFTKFSNQRKENNNNMSCRILSSITKSSLNYKYETLEKATNYFNSSRKIGEGGSGSVFKGILPNGNIVAVKRLVYNNREWVDEFFNEVNLISGVEHKNLVKLLGCSIEGPESLLVYEYIPNNSLDQFIFVTEKSTNPPQILNWKERFNIIVGIAEGLNYLHEGCKIRIIHRDIKSSNVLLDENLSPKIADFGLARCLAADKTHLSTGIAGTLGYMAPEYLIRGQVTDKVDVYSFGVLVIEIICGRRNNVLREEDSGSLLQTVWKLHGSNKLGEAIDCRLGDDFAETEAEASRVFHIALLCTQASSSLRPSMLQVVQMLTNSNLQLPIPTQPPFLNTSTIHSDTTLSYYSTNSFVSNAMQP